MTFIAYPGSAYGGDWSNLVPGLMVTVVIVLVGRIIIPFYRRVIGVSVYEYFGKRFGYPVRVYSSIAYACGHFSKMGFVFYLLALTVTSMTGWSTERVIVLVGIVTIVYTLVGGIEAVIWADAIQGFVIWAGIAICLGYLLFCRRPARSLRSKPPGTATRSASAASRRLRKPTIIVLAIYGFFYYLQRYTADQTVASAIWWRSRIARRGVGSRWALCCVSRCGACSC